MADANSERSAVKLDDSPEKIARQIHFAIIQASAVIVVLIPTITTLNPQIPNIVRFSYFAALYPFIAAAFISTLRLVNGMTGKGSAVSVYSLISFGLGWLLLSVVIGVYLEGSSILGLIYVYFGAFSALFSIVLVLLDRYGERLRKRFPRKTLAASEGGQPSRATEPSQGASLKTQVVAGVIITLIGIFLFAPAYNYLFTPNYPRMAAQFTINSAGVQFNSFPNCTRISASQAGQSIGTIYLTYINIQSGGLLWILATFSYSVTITQQHSFNEYTQNTFHGLTEGVFRIETVLSQLPPQNSSRVVIYLQIQLWNGTKVLDNRVASASC